MSGLLNRRTFLRGIGSLLALGLAGCASKESTGEASGRAAVDIAADEEQREDGASEQSEQKDASGTSEHEDEQNREETPMQILVTVNDVQFTATIEDTAAGQELLARLPLTLQMEELHGNEKYCYTGESFGGEQEVPETIETGDLMVFGSDCVVLFYETFSNGGWSYARVGKIDDTAGLAEACGSGAAAVAFAALSA
jgi:hypothetical protein